MNLSNSLPVISSALSSVSLVQGNKPLDLLGAVDSTFCAKIDNLRTSLLAVNEQCLHEFSAL
jgi:hypothetical protein